MFTSKSIVSLTYALLWLRHSCLVPDPVHVLGNACERHRQPLLAANDVPEAGRPNQRVVILEHQWPAGIAVARGLAFLVVGAQGRRLDRSRVQKRALVVGDDLQGHVLQSVRDSTPVLGLAPATGDRHPAVVVVVAGRKCHRSNAIVELDLLGKLHQRHVVRSGARVVIFVTDKLRGILHHSIVSVSWFSKLDRSQGDQNRLSIFDAVASGQDPFVTQQTSAAQGPFLAHLDDQHGLVGKLAGSRIRSANDPG